MALVVGGAIGAPLYHLTGARGGRSSACCRVKVSTSIAVKCSVILGSRDDRTRKSKLETSGTQRPVSVTSSRFRKKMEAQGLEVEGPLFCLSKSPSTMEAAIVLVSRAGNCLSLDAICEKLKAVRSRGGLGIGIAMKPFSFEGQRRLDKAERIFATLRSAADLLIVIDHDILMRRDGLTVMEATSISNDLFVLAIEALSQLISGQATFYGQTTSSVNDMVLNFLGEANVSFGGGHSLKEAVEQALDMLSTEKRDHVICAVAKSTQVRMNEIQSVLGVLRSVTSPRSIVACVPVNDTNLAFGRYQVVLLSPSGTTKPSVPAKISARQVLGEARLGESRQELGSTNFRNLDTSFLELLVTKAFASTPRSTRSLEDKRSEADAEKEIGPFSDAARAWAESRQVAEPPRLPVHSYLEAQANNVNPLQPLPCDPAAVPDNSVLRIGFEAVLSACKTASGLMKDKDARKGISLSQRAASMLENERSPKCLPPSVKVSYQNGSFEGRGDGGQPDGKGRFTYADGSFYEGHWAQGKRNGMGTFHYANGDVYQGFWHDNLMHGKGWLYFHNGDRFQADFVQGKAHGLARYYSTNGSSFFGQFQDNQRHGEGIFRDPYGSRWQEVWDFGILISKMQI